MERQCTATAKSTGGRCQKPPILGGTVCKIHGGGAPQVIAAAERRKLEELVGPALAELKKIVDDPYVKSEVKLRAIVVVLDRTFFGAKSEHEITGRISLERLQEELAFYQQTRAGS